MRYFLLLTLITILGLHYCDTTHRQHFQIATWQAAITDSNAIDMLSSLHANDSSIRHFFAANKDRFLDLKQCTTKKGEMVRPAIAQHKTSSGPVELTLEYIAVQLPRSHATQ